MILMYQLAHADMIDHVQVVYNLMRQGIMLIIHMFGYLNPKPQFITYMQCFPEFLKPVRSTYDVH